MISRARRLCLASCGIVVLSSSATAQGAHTTNSTSGLATTSPRATSGRIPRLWDRRVGPTFVNSKTHYVIRQRLERRDSSVAGSDVVRPLVYTIDSSVPRQWVPWIRRGIEAWIPAFDQIGFKHAIVVREAVPGKPIDAAMPGCVVTWVDVHNDGAVTGMESDSTTGDVTSCTITLNPGVIEMLQRYGFLFLGGNYPQMRYPFPDSISGKLFQIVVTHETGHSLGFDENFEAGTSYPTDSLHSASFVHRFGFTPSVMGYAFFDAVARPEDHIPFDDLLGRVGPRDLWTLRWIYQPVSGAKSAQDETTTLERWQSIQDTSPFMQVKTSLPNAGSADGYLLGSDLVASAAAISQNMAQTVPDIQRQAATSTNSSELAAKLQNTTLNAWPIAVVAPGDIVGSSIPSPPYTREVEQQRKQPMDSAQQVRALRFAIAHTMYGQDPLVQALFGRSSTDTSLMLFEKAAPGWTVQQWQGLQQMMLQHLLNHWFPGVMDQANTTHVLPVVCETLWRFRNDLTKASTDAADPARSQAQGLLAQLAELARVCPEH